MASSEFLRKNKNQHSIKNSLSKKMEGDINLALKVAIRHLRSKYPNVRFEHVKIIKLKEVIGVLKKKYPKLSSNFSGVMDGSFMSPDGGFLYATNSAGQKNIILVAEVKRQGTNDKRAVEGKAKQARGNAIERLGKNLIGIRAMFRDQKVIPFICFGSGDDFKEGSTIRDRVTTMNEFFPLNHLFVEKNFLPFEPVSLLFREAGWSTKEMSEAMIRVSERALKAIN